MCKQEMLNNKVHDVIGVSAFTSKADTAVGYKLADADTIFKTLFGMDSSLKRGIIIENDLGINFEIEYPSDKSEFSLSAENLDKHKLVFVDFSEDYPMLLMAISIETGALGLYNLSTDLELIEVAPCVFDSIRTVFNFKLLEAYGKSYIYNTSYGFAEVSEVKEASIDFTDMVLTLLVLYDNMGYVSSCFVVEYQKSDGTLKTASFTQLELLTNYSDFAYELSARYPSNAFIELFNEVTNCRPSYKPTEFYSDWNLVP